MNVVTEKGTNGLPLSEVEAEQITTATETKKEKEKVADLEITENDIKNFGTICGLALSMSVKNRNQLTQILIFEEQFIGKLKALLTPKSK